MLQPHEGTSETRWTAERTYFDTELQPHEGTSETPLAFHDGVLHLPASTPRGYV